MEGIDTRRESGELGQLLTMPLAASRTILDRRAIAARRADLASEASVLFLDKSTVCLCVCCVLSCFFNVYCLKIEIVNADFREEFEPFFRLQPNRLKFGDQI
jgi:hypothetical protein